MFSEWNITNILQLRLFVGLFTGFSHNFPAFSDKLSIEFLGFSNPQLWVMLDAAFSLELNLKVGTRITAEVTHFYTPKKSPCWFRAGVSFRARFPVWTDESRVSIQGFPPLKDTFQAQMDPSLDDLWRTHYLLFVLQHLLHPKILCSQLKTIFSASGECGELCFKM